jgi:SAM-dependent methyltransferase
MAQAFPRSTFFGFNNHGASIDQARKAAADAGVADRVRFEVAPAQSFPGVGYDLVACFDCLHDMGDPAGAARHIRSALDDDGTWLLVEPRAGDRVEDNLNPVGRIFYAASVLICSPHAVSGGLERSARAPGRRGPAARPRARQRVHPLPPRDGDAVQPRAGGAPRRAGPAWTSARRDQQTPTPGRQSPARITAAAASRGNDRTEAHDRVGTHAETVVPRCRAIARSSSSSCSSSRTCSRTLMPAA